MIRNIFCIVIFIQLVSCAEEENRAPIIFDIKAEPEIVAPNSFATITVKAGDPDKDKLLYSWSASKGAVDGIGESVKWYSPSEEGKYEIVVVVSDGKLSTSKAKTIRVWSVRAGDYYPLSIGSKWRYKDSENNSIDFEIIDTIDVSGTKVFVKQIKTSSLESAVNYSYLSKSDKGVEQYGSGGASVGGDTIIFAPPLLLYKFPLILDDAWEQDFDVKVPDGFFVGNGKAKYKVIAEETLTVPAGTFQHVFQVREDFVWELIGQELDRTISDYWLAPNVGIIKFRTEQIRANNSFSVEAVLYEYLSP